MTDNNAYREPEANIDQIFINRWSPRSFSKSFELDQNTIDSLFEAARWSPSCFNEQPWRFVIAKRGEEKFDTFVDLLKEDNQKWAKDASLLGFIVAKRSFSKTGKKNQHAVFDCGSAWMSLTMQARTRGLHTHAMAGIKYDDIYKILNIPSDDYRVICAFAVGQRGPKDKLDGELAEKEEMNSRMSSDEFVFYGGFDKTADKH